MSSPLPEWGGPVSNHGMSAKVVFLMQEKWHRAYDSIYDHLEKDFDLRCVPGTDMDAVVGALEWADVAFLDCVQDVAAAVSCLPRRGKLVALLRGFEVHTTLATVVNWDNVDALCVTSSYLVDLLRFTVSDIASRVDIHILPTGIDMDHVPPRERFDPTGKMGFVNDLCYFANYPLALQCFAAASFDPGLSLHVAGEYAGNERERMELALYSDNLIASMGLSNRIHVEGKVRSLFHWLEDKEFFLHTACGATSDDLLYLAMARGVRPIVHHFPGATDLLPQELVFDTVDQFRNVLDAVRPFPSELRDYVAESRPLSVRLAAVDRLMEGLLAPSP